MLAKYNMQSCGASLVFLRTLGEVISEEYISITKGTCGKVVECGCVFVSLRLS